MKTYKVKLATDSLKRPIAEAPTDGTEIYVVHPDNNELYRCVWDPKGDSRMPDGTLKVTGIWSCIDDHGEYSNPGRHGGWFEEGEATHWQSIEDTDKNLSEINIITEKFYGTRISYSNEN